MNCVICDICVYHLGLFVFFPGVFFSSRVTGACPVNTDLMMQVNVRTTTTATIYGCQKLNGCDETSPLTTTRDHSTFLDASFVSPTSTIVYGGGAWPHYSAYQRNELASNGNYYEPDAIAVRHGICGDPEQVCCIIQRVVQQFQIRIVPCIPIQNMLHQRAK